MTPHELDFVTKTAPLLWPVIADTFIADTFRDADPEKVADLAVEEAAHLYQAIERFRAGQFVEIERRA